MIEFVDTMTKRPVEFQYSEDEIDTACFSAVFYRNMAGRFALALGHSANDIEKSQTQLTSVQVELMDGGLLAVRSHLFIAQKILPTVVKVDQTFRVADALNPEVQYTDVCDGYGVNADDLSRYALLAGDMIRCMPEIRYLG